MEIPELTKIFQIDGRVRSSQEYGEGHINTTVLAELEDGRSYLLQAINTEIFRNVQELMDNIQKVTEYLRKKVMARGGDVQRETLQIIPARDGRLFYQDPSGTCWRVYPYIPGTVTYQSFDHPDIFQRCGEAFGGFLADLAGFPASTLYEVLPDFHNTRKRFEALLKAVESDTCGRVKEVEKEIRFALEREELYGQITDMLNSGQIPLRVTHNDTKVNNVLVDAQTGQGVCVIDLDTVMPGSCLYDFGDAVRFGAATEPEDTRNPEAMAVNLELFTAFARGYLSGTRGTLTLREVESLPLGAMMMTLENGIRFLTDYLEGDTYFKIHRPGHNLDRCRAQFALAADMERRMQELNAAVRAVQ